jgi:hypothetical protein
MWMFPFAFEDPAKAAERRVARAQRALAKKQPWPEVKPVRPDAVWEDVGIIADTFAPHNPLAAIFPDVVVGIEDGVESPDGRLRYVRQPLPLYHGLPVGQSRSDYGGDSRAYFDAEIDVPALHYRSRFEGCTAGRWEVWMGLAPLELWTQRSGIKAATGDVVLGGLGMGWLLSEIAAKPSVKSIVVVERDKMLLDWFGRRLCAALPKVKDVLCADVFEVAERFDYGKTRFVLDIWPTLGDAKWDRRLEKLRNDGARCWAWGSARGAQRNWPR